MYLLFRTTAVIILITIIQVTTTLAQQPMAKLTISNGLSNNAARCIFQDKKGFMWFGTADGLNRYDGYDVKVYRNRYGDSSSLQHNYIYAISQDSKQNLWVGTGQGLMFLDPLTDRFEWANYRGEKSGLLHKLQFTINVIKADKKGNLFIGTNSAGAFIKPYNSDTCIPLSLKRGKDVLSSFSCYTIDISNDGVVWMVLDGIGLCKYDYTSKQVTLINDAFKLASCIKADNNGNNIWLSNRNVLYKYDKNLNKAVNVYRAESGQLFGGNITCLLPGKSGDLYIGTEGGGVTVLNTKSGKSRYLRQGQNSDLFGKGVIMDIYQDNESRIWIATTLAGVYTIDRQRNHFQTFRHETNNSYSLANNYVTSLCEYDKAHLWIGTENGSVSILNRTTGRFQNYKHLKSSAGSLNSNPVSSIVKDYLGNVWIATFGGGIYLFNSKNNAFKFYDIKNQVNNEINLNVVFMFEDSRKTLWAATFSNGRLYRFDRKQNKFIVFDQEINDPYAICEDREGQLWCGNAGYLIRLNLNTHRHVFYEIDKPVREIYEDRAGNFWLGTEGGGLVLFDRKSGKVVQRYTDKDGLSNNGVLNIIEDNSGKLWLTTFSGITTFAYKSKAINTYYQDDGLQSNQFSANAAVKLQSGEIALGGVNGFNLFCPDSITNRTYMPPVVFTNISINNKPPSKLNTFVNSDVTGKISALKVPYNEAILSFSFAGLEYSAPEHIKYAYYLEGLDKNWRPASAQRTISYNNIPEGNYTLHIRSTNASGKWNKHQTTLKVIITPPWFRTWWAYLFYTASIVGLILAFIRYKTSKARLQYQINLERMNREKEAELSMRKTSFFTHVSHEFRTPLMLIINPLQEVLARRGCEKDVELNIVFRNARRLVSLIDQLLLFNKTENDGSDLQVSVIRFSELCRLVYESFIYQARNKAINYELQMDNDNIELYGDKLKIEVILYNLLSNAFRYTDNGGTVVFKVSHSEDYINVAISDNGYGIPPETGNHLFEKFYRSANPKSNQKTGFGIGLYLVKQFVNLHKATINYESELGKGTTFFINFRAGKAHFNDIEIQEASDDDNLFLDELSGEQEIPVDGSEPNNDPANIVTDEHTALQPNAFDVPLEEVVVSTRTMLVIDDHPDMRAYLKQIFKGQFIILEAADGNEGILMAKEYLPDIIISDIMMDGKNGLELCKEIRVNPSLNHIPIILITANSSQEVKLKGVQLGADDFFSKPIDKELLTARIYTLLESRNSLQNYFYRSVTLKNQVVKISEDEKLFIDRCIAITESHLEDDDFGVDELAKAVNMSRANLFKKIKQVSNQTPNKFIRFVRLRHAAELFINSALNINEVSVIVGFKDTKYFREQFAQLFGLNPSEYIKKYRGPFSKKFSINPAIRKKQ